MFNRRVLLSTGLFAGVFVTIPGCGEQTEGFVYVDNGLEEAIVVEVDGKKVATIRPGATKKLTLDLGPRKFRVTSGQRVVYEATHTLDYGDRPFRRPKYLLNPDRSHRYCEVEVVYGDDTLNRASTDALVTLISKAASRRVEGNDDEAQRRKWERDRKIEAKYRSLARDFVAFGDEPFFQIETPRYILEPLPNVVVGSRHSSSEERSTLIRVPQPIHDFIQQAALIEHPTPEDLEKLTTAQELVRVLIPFK